MKLFLDTTNTNLLIGLIDENNKVLSLVLKPTERNVVKIAYWEVKNFLSSHKLNFGDIQEYYLNIGPGSFTGVKVAYNIIGTIDLVYPIKSIYVIDTFSLLRKYNGKYVFLKVTKRTYLVWKKTPIGYKITETDNIEEITQRLEKKDLPYQVGYEGFKKTRLEKRLKNFKKVGSLSDVKLRYEK